MRAKIRHILEECIDTGIEHGLNMAHKHTDNPTELNIRSCIELAIWYEIDQRFEFDRDLVSEVVKGFDHNELIQALEEAVYLLAPTEEDMQKKAGVYRIVTALEMLKEKNA